MLYALGVLSEVDRRYLEALAGRIAAAEEALAGLVVDRDEAIRIALDGDGKPTELARLFGLSRERIYQINRGR